MRRIARIAGRLDDQLVIGGRTVLPSQIEALILKQQGLEPFYQLVLSQDGGVDQLAVHVEAGLALAPDSVARAHLASELKQAMQETLGLVAAVEIAASGILPRSEGRATRVLGRQPA
jgi:phenylacetate-CoA ligase